MSEGLLQSFNINELAGATGLILGGVSGLLVVIFKSRCYCKFRIGCNDQCSLCMCERKPPPDTPVTDGNDTDDDDKKNILPKNKSFKKSKTSEGQAQQRALGPEPQSESPERLIPPNDDIDRLV
jgi:hypothetical protein